MMTAGSPARESTYRWAILAAFFFVTGLSGFGHFIYPAIGTFVADDLRLSATQIGMLGGGSFFGAMLFSLFAGFLADRLGVRGSAWVCGIVLVAAFGLSALADRFAQLVALAVIVGCGLSLVNPLTQKGTLLWFPSRDLGLAVGIKQGGVPACSALIAALLPLVCVAYGWRASFVVAALIAALTLAVMLAVYREPAGGPLVKSAAPPRLRDVLDPAAETKYRVIGFAGLAHGALTVSLVNFFVPMLRDQGISPVQAGAYLAAAQFLSIFIRPLVGIGSDRFRHGSRTQFLGAYILLGGALVALWPLIAGGGIGVGTLVGSAIALGLTNSWSGLYYTVAAEIGGPARVGVSVGFCAFANSLGTAGGPMAYGWLADMTGTWTYGLLAMCLFSMTAGMACLTLRGPTDAPALLAGAAR